MTLTQLNAFVLVARLGSVRAAASALGVSESAVSQALTALRQDLGDQLITRSQAGMTLTPGGTRLLGTASQIVVLGAEAHAAVRAAQGAPEQLRIVATSTFAEFVAAPLLEAFRRRFAGAVEITTGVAAAGELPVLIANRLADVAIGPGAVSDHELPIVSEPIFKFRLVVVGSGTGGAGGGSTARPRGLARQWRWLVDPSGTDPDSEAARLLRRLGVADSNIGVFQSQTAAWAAAADGSGVAPAIEHLVSHQIRRGELSLIDLPGVPVEERWYVTLLERERRSTAASALRRFLGTPEAMQLMRSPAAGVPPSRFKPPVYVTIWS
ncbi:LysR family transcriptional regulator [Trebonia kvetii]|uniref:LysR family transcriptional regulator n=2 Tax=Trebonia kvetii TaxID=2480626 RepID=A0A6P2C7R4_9ACTN|nr:LysR family transcriptional regulator [Trebonia kvetii]